ncbi:LOW QUALITY PROTEIN: kinase suppressor of Ras 2 [Pogonomyrmex barbatus]|uniref:LOW QUALITY PROTEIN: kinase suppressor of Ras 2 n=1 Tax=Pogonomyrmex barbatus TaxID=144034 RepID=A0A6I9W011_9HYME|nr:LOW QUALITY PROTEIN: kinase suppressor of Ras 2 [Pogonomyrmex barbatus]
MAAYRKVLEVQRILDITQIRIEVSVDILDSMRTQCASTSEITHEEIKDLETKLIKLYSTQLVTKATLTDPIPAEINQYPSLQLWLRTVGLTQESIQMVCSHVNTLEALKEKSEHELSCMLNEKSIHYQEEHRRLCKALHCLRQCIDIMMKEGMENVCDDLDLYWDSWNSYHLRNEVFPKPIQFRTARRSIPSENSIPYHNNNNNNNNLNNDMLPSASIASLILSSPSYIPSLPKQGYEFKFPSTPPPRRKYFMGVQNNILQPEEIGEVFPLAKSKSHESHLASRPDNIQLNNDDISSSFKSNSSKKESDSSVRNPTEPSSFGTIDSGREESFLPCYNSPIKSHNKSPVKSPVKSPIKSPIIKSPVKPSNKLPVKSPPLSICTTNAKTDDSSLKETVNLEVPTSPCTTPTVLRGIGHTITHRFTKSFNVMTICDYCEKSMFMNILKCKDCKYRCHRECASKAPASCGLPEELFMEFTRSVHGNNVNVSPVLSRPGVTFPNSHNVNVIGSLNHRDRRRSYTQSSMNIAFHGDSSPNIFTYNRSTPSSPALLSATISHSMHCFLKQQFCFPDIPNKKRRHLRNWKRQHKDPKLIANVLNDKSEKDDIFDTCQDRIVNISRSDNSHSHTMPLSIDSLDSLFSDNGGDETGYDWPRQNSILMRDWDISYNKLVFGELIGEGRFATVYKGVYHGEVAIKVLNMNYCSNNEKILQEFRLKTAMFQKTRHDNVTLFLGACTNPPQLVVVSRLTRGQTLYTLLHLRKDRFSLAQLMRITEQICHGMGYLHARGIIHKDLRSKNIFYECGQIVISDFGLFDVTKLCYGYRRNNELNVPPNWLCYLAPEIVRQLRPISRGLDRLPFSMHSDTYAFGTIWYELLCGELPFRGQPTEAIIWQVGKGMKQSLANLQTSREVKDILILCWSYHARIRPNFTEIRNLLQKLPCKKLERSSSNPMNFSRSAESMF